MTERCKVYEREYLHSKRLVFDRNGETYFLEEANSMPGAMLEYVADNKPIIEPAVYKTGYNFLTPIPRPLAVHFAKGEDHENKPDIIGSCKHSCG